MPASIPSMNLESQINHHVNPYPIQSKYEPL